VDFIVVEMKEEWQWLCALGNRNCHAEAC